MIRSAPRALNFFHSNIQSNIYINYLLQGKGNGGAGKGMKLLLLFFFSHFLVVNSVTCTLLEEDNLGRENGSLILITLVVKLVQ